MHAPFSECHPLGHDAVGPTVGTRFTLVGGTGVNGTGVFVQVGAGRLVEVGVPGPVGGSGVGVAVAVWLGGTAVKYSGVGTG